MIRRLRRRHLWLLGGVAAIGAPLYLAALASRPAPAVQEALPSPLAEPPAAAAGEAIALPTTPPILVRSAGAGAIEARAEGVVEGADLLLYWAPASDSPSLADAYLLGPIRGGERQLFDLPAEAVGTPGVLIVYSLGHGEEIALAPWPTTGTGP